MNFASDNAYGATPEILAAVAAAAEGSVPSYGEDEITKRVTERLSEVFERAVAAFPVITGSAANSLALATLCPPHGAIFCHEGAHIQTDECAAPEFFTHGAKLVPLAGKDGKITPASVEAMIPFYSRGVHSSKPCVISITQLTELGTAYAPDEVAAIGDFAHGHGMTLHMDGARFANALAGLGCKPADITWRAGVDAMSFGATKNGALAAECVIFFDPALAADFEYRRKKSGHLLSKMRFVSAQLEAYLTDDRWLKMAAHANGLAQRLAQGLARVEGAELANPVQGNQLFVYLPDDVVARLREAGAKFYDWEPSREGRTLIRLVTSFATPEADVARFVEVAAR